MVTLEKSTRADTDAEAGGINWTGILAALEEVNRAAKRFPRQSDQAKCLYRAKDSLLSVCVCGNEANVELAYQANGERHANSLLISICDSETGRWRSFHAAFDLLSMSARARVFNRIGAPPSA